MGGGVASQLPVSSTSTAPAAPRGASTAPTPRSTSGRAADTTGSGSPWATAASNACGVWPSTLASSSAFGLIRSGAARSKDATSAARGPSEVSIATRQGYGASSATTWAYQWSGTPGGREPDSTTHEAASAAEITARVSASSAAASSVAPGSLTLVVVPSCSVMAKLVRTAPAVGTH